MFFLNIVNYTLCSSSHSLHKILETPQVLGLLWDSNFGLGLVNTWYLHHVADDQVGVGRDSEAVAVHDLRGDPGAVKVGLDRAPTLNTEEICQPLYFKRESRHRYHDALVLLVLTLTLWWLEGFKCLYQSGYWMPWLEVFKCLILTANERVGWWYKMVWQTHTHRRTQPFIVKDEATFTWEQAGSKCCFSDRLGWWQIWKNTLL